MLVPPVTPPGVKTGRRFTGRTDWPPPGSIESVAHTTELTTCDSAVLQSDESLISLNPPSTLTPSGRRIASVASRPRRLPNNASSDEPAGMLTGYLAILPDTGAMGGYTYAAGFSGRDAHFTLPIFDADSGDPLAVLDGASMNPHKTGAAGAVGVDALARRDASDLAIIGSGAQARGQVRPRRRSVISTA